MTSNSISDEKYPLYQTLTLVFIVMVFGTFLRIQYLQKTDFVLNDGGMFFTMVQDLQKNGYTIPSFTSYNNNQIPFAYPPMSFYISAILNQYLHINLITILRYYPLFFNILSIPAFFLLAKEITRNHRQALLATAFYSILLPSYEWLISGGGLTRSPAQTLFIIALYFFLSYIRTRKIAHLFISILAAALMTLNHIEYCWLLMISFGVFSVNSFNSKEYLKTGFCYLGCSAILTAPYWVTVILKHGLTPFISAFSSGDFDLATSFGRLAIMVFTQETLVNYINVLAIIGLLFCILTRKINLVIWLILIVFLNPRSAERSLIFPITIFAAMTIDKVICPSFDLIYQNSIRIFTETRGNQRLIMPNFANVFIAFSIIYPFVLGYIGTFSPNPALVSITSNEREGMNWVKSNSRADSKFVVMSPSISWFLDKEAEWFPALSERISYTTVQGTEWLQNSEFIKKKRIYNEFKECVNIGEPCLASWADRNNIIFTYLYLSKSNCQSNNNCLNYFESTVLLSQKYQVVFENDGVTIFRKKGY